MADLIKKIFLPLLIIGILVFIWSILFQNDLSVDSVYAACGKGSDCGSDQECKCGNVPASRNDPNCIGSWYVDGMCTQCRCEDRTSSPGTPQPTNTPTPIVDRSPPNAPSAPDLAADSDTGSSPTDNITKAATLTFTGTAEAASTVTLYRDNVVQSPTGIATGGNWSITLTGQSSGTFTAKATDAANNTSIASGGLLVIVDTIPPTGTMTAPVAIASTAPANVSATLNTALGTISGTADDSSGSGVDRVEVVIRESASSDDSMLSCGGTSPNQDWSGSAWVQECTGWTASGTTSWQYTSVPPASQLLPGKYYHISFRVVDKAGNDRGWEAPRAKLQYTGSTTPSTDPVAHWAFDGDFGRTVHDSTSNNNDGTLEGLNNPVVQLESGRVGDYALKFDGSNNFVRVPDSPSLNIINSFTMSFWVKPDRDLPRNGTYTLISKGNSAGFDGQYLVGLERVNAGYASSTKIVFCARPGFGCQTGDKNLTLGAWNHVLVTFDGRKVSYYLDGVLDKEYGFRGQLTADRSAVILGSLRNGNNKFAGLMDEVKIYNRVLTDEQVAELVNIYPRSCNFFRVCQSSGRAGAQYCEGGTQRSAQTPCEPPANPSCWGDFVRGDRLRLNDCTFPVLPTSTPTPTLTSTPTLTPTPTVALCNFFQACRDPQGNPGHQYCTNGVMDAQGMCGFVQGSICYKRYGSNPSDRETGCFVLPASTPTPTLSPTPTLTPTPTTTPAPVAGDADGNRCVDDFDYTIWQCEAREYIRMRTKSPAEVLCADWTGQSGSKDNIVDIYDYNAWYQAARARITSGGTPCPSPPSDGCALLPGKTCRRN